MFHAKPRRRRTHFGRISRSGAVNLASHSGMEAGRTYSSRSSRPRIDNRLRRLALEGLEDRMMMTVCSDISGELNTRLGQLQSAIDSIGNAASVLPVVNESVADVLKEAQAVTHFTQELVNALNEFDTDGC